MPCPHCRSVKVLHTWRCDMRTMQWLDDYKCSQCGEHWMERTTPQKLPIIK